MNDLALAQALEALLDRFDRCSVKGQDSSEICNEMAFWLTEHGDRVVNLLRASAEAAS